MSTLVSFCLIYVLYVIVPLIPSILIYKIFPDTNLNLSGPFHGLKLNATGAFAGYIICCLLGYSVISRAMDEIETKPTWKFNAKIQLVKSDGVTLLNDQEAEYYLKQLNPTINPPMVWHNDNTVTMYLAQDLLENNATISLGGIEGFVPKNINQSDIDKVHKVGRVIDYGTITLRQFGASKQYDTSKHFPLPATIVAKIK